MRVRNVLGRAVGDSSGAAEGRGEVFHFEGWCMDLGGHSVTGPDKDTVSFTRAEFNLLAALVKSPGRVLSRAQLLDAVSQDADAPTDRLIDVLISRIRKKIEAEPKKPKIITTVLGCGYKFSAELDQG